MYPVDLPDVSDAEVTSASERYLSCLESPGHQAEQFTSGNSWKVSITASNISRLQLFEDDQPPCWVPALHHPEDPTQVVAVRLQDSWWTLEDVLRTSGDSRSGLLPARSIAERLIVLLLSRVVERPPEGAPLFSLHRRTESCKVLWRDGRAVGFYSIKHRGSLCDSWSSCCYLLTVLDTVLVRRSSRRRGLGLLMLEDFCSSFSAEEFLGVSSPISASMAAVLRKFLQQHPEHRDRLYEVEAPGGWTERRNIWLGLQLGRYVSMLLMLEVSSGRRTHDRASAGVTSGGDQENEANGSALQSPTLDVTPPGSCSAKPLPPPPPRRDELNGEPSQRGSSPGGEIPETGRGAAAPSLNPERPPHPSARPCTEEPQEVQPRAKRAKRTRVKL